MTGGDWGLKDGTKFDFDKGEFYFAVQQTNTKNTSQCSTKCTKMV